MTKKELIEFLMRSDYSGRIIIKIRYAGVNYKGEDTFEFTSLRHTILVNAKDLERYIRAYGNYTRKVDEEQESFNYLCQKHSAHLLEPIVRPCDNIFDPNDYIGYCSDKYAFGKCKILRNLASSDGRYKTINAEFTPENALKFLTTTYVYTICRCGTVNRITLDDAMSEYPTCSKCSLISHITYQMDHDRRESRSNIHFYDATDIDHCRFKCTCCGTIYTENMESVVVQNRRYGKCASCYAKDQIPKIIGKKNGKLTVIDAVPVIDENDHSISYYNAKCECSCGRIVYAKYAIRPSGNKLYGTSCKYCDRKYPGSMEAIDARKGEKHGKLKIIKKAYTYYDANGIKDFNTVQRVICQCECGNFAIVPLSALKLNKVKSCGHCGKKMNIPFPYDLTFYEMQYNEKE
jgi:hypothetical protein